VLDLLANFARLMLPEWQVTNEGFEKTLATGYLSVCVLCRKLMPSLSKAANPRIVNVAGVPRFVLTQLLDLDDLAFEKKYGGCACKDSPHEDSGGAASGPWHHRELLSHRRGPGRRLQEQEHVIPDEYGL
jgi:hypothetical protein